MTTVSASAGFSSDNGSADPRVAAALAAHADGSGGSGDVLLALASSRLLVPVVAVLDELDEDGAGEKSSHMATVSTIGRSGRRGMLAFTSTDTMRAWDPNARPVPVSTRAAAEAALADGADAIVIDLAGPVTFAVEAADLRGLAAGWRSHTGGLMQAGPSGNPGRPAGSSGPTTSSAASAPGRGVGRAWRRLRHRQR